MVHASLRPTQCANTRPLCFPLSAFDERKALRPRVLLSQESITHRITQSQYNTSKNHDFKRLRTRLPLPPQRRASRQRRPSRDQEATTLRHPRTTYVPPFPLSARSGKPKLTKKKPFRSRPSISNQADLTRRRPCRDSPAGSLHAESGRGE